MNEGGETVYYDPQDHPWPQRAVHGTGPGSCMPSWPVQKLIMVRNIAGEIIMNGTTAYDLFSDPAFDPESVQTPWWAKGLASMMSTGTKPKKDGRDESDYADYDMHIDHAAELNWRITTLPYTYYFSVPCSTTKYQEDGTCLPEKGTEPMFVMRSCQIGAYKGKTAGGLLRKHDIRGFYMDLLGIIDKLPVEEDVNADRLKKGDNCFGL